MPPRMRLFFAFLSLVLFLIAAGALVRELFQRNDIWWTPFTMLVPLTEGKDRVEIYARGKSLEVWLQAGRLRIDEDGGSGALSASDVGLRFNNWDRVRAQRIPLLLGYAAMCGFTTCMFLLIVTGRLAYRGPSEP